MAEPVPIWAGHVVPIAIGAIKRGSQFVYMARKSADVSRLICAKSCDRGIVLLKSRCQNLGFSASAYKIYSPRVLDVSSLTFYDNIATTRVKNIIKRKTRLI